MDSRLTFNATSPSYNYTLATPVQNNIWTPTAYMEPEWRSHDADTRVIRIFPTGLLVESKRFVYLLTCVGQMQLNNVMCPLVKTLNNLGISPV